MTLKAPFVRLMLAAVMTAPLSIALAAKPASDPAGGDTLELWPGGVPGAEHVTVKEEIVDRAVAGGPLLDRAVQHVTKPLVTLFPPQGKPNGVTLLIVPGGGYVRVVIDKEGFEAADWFAARGFAAAVLRYRLPGDGWASGPDAPVHDAMRAMRLLRQRTAAKDQRFGVIGYSAGGHLVARYITEPDLAYTHRDAADDLSARPDFAVLMYPVILTSGAGAHSGSAQQLLAAGVKPDDLARYSPDRNVTAAMPPTMLVHAADDTTVPVANSLRMYEALHAAGVRSELHVFDRGGHGFGLRSIAGKDVAAWPGLVETWALVGSHE
jgi:acetyl esterase/lipase